jgi:hypothetical protein
MGIEVTLVWSNQNDITCLPVLLLQVTLNHNIQHFIWPSTSYITHENTYKSLKEMNFQIFFFNYLCQNTNHNQTCCLVPFMPATAR